VPAAVEPAGALRIAIVAPLVTTITEPQQGGSQVLLADLAVGLTEHGHDVDVYAATGSTRESIQRRSPTR
jgi:hypothetical protein